MQTRADSRSVEKVKLFCSNACATSAKGAWQVRRVATNTDGRAVVACSARAPFAARGRGGCTLPCVCASEIDFKTSEANEEQSRTAFDQHTVL